MSHSRVLPTPEQKPSLPTAPHQGRPVLSMWVAGLAGAPDPLPQPTPRRGAAPHPHSDSTTGRDRASCQACLEEATLR